MTWLARPAMQAFAIFAGFLALHLAWAVENDRLGWASFGKFTAVFLVPTLVTIVVQRRVQGEWTWRRTAKVFAAVLVVEAFLTGVLFLRR